MKQPVKLGRPPNAAGPLKKNLFVKLTQAEHDELRAAAVAERRTITEVVRSRVFAKKMERN